METSASPGVAIGCGVAFLVAFVGALVLALRLSRAARERAAAFAAERGSQLADALASAGMVTSPDAALPADLPELGIPRFPSRTRFTLAAGERGSARWWLLDAEIPNFERPGWNLEVTSSADSRDAVSRHTFVLRRDSWRRLPELLVLPDVRAEMRARIDDRLRAENLQDHRAARWVANLSDRWIGQQEGPEPRIGIRELDGRYRVTGADEDAVRRALAPKAVGTLLATPGAILAADGEWLMVGRNVALARGRRDSDLPFGLSTAAELPELLALAQALDGALRSGS